MEKPKQRHAVTLEHRQGRVLTFTVCGATQAKEGVPPADAVRFARKGDKDICEDCLSILVK